MANAYMGVLYQKIFDSAGNITGKTPFLPRTLSSLIILSDGSGNTLDTKVKTMESNISSATSKANSAASTASTVLQTGDCQQVRRTGRFLQGGGGGQDEQRFGCIVIMPLSHRWNS